MEEKGKSKNGKIKALKFPSKVLLAGGYGVLQEGNEGFVLALQNYFYATQEISESDQTIIEVMSPQISSLWTYRVSAGKVEQIKGESDNRFVRCSIQQTLKCIDADKFKNKKVAIYLLFDRGFLSDSNRQSTQQSQKFLNYVAASSKTGLGSSACVVTSVISMLCLAADCLDLKLVNALSHISNLAAQNKIGSNFDVSSALFGSHIYVNRFPKAAQRYLESSDKAIFDMKIDQLRRIKVGSSVKVYMLDQKKGADTRVMVGSFLKQLQKQPKQVSEEFFTKSKSIVEELLTCFGSKQKMKQVNLKHRLLQQKYSELTNVPIQPKQLKELLDRIIVKQEVMYAICPGSGGYDAICVLADKEINLEAMTFQISEQGMKQVDQDEQKEIEKYLNFVLQ